MTNVMHLQTLDLDSNALEVLSCLSWQSCTSSVSSKTKDEGQGG